MGGKNKENNTPGKESSIGLNFIFRKCYALWLLLET